MTSSNLRRLHHRQVGRFRALEDAAGIDADLTLRIRKACAVAHQPADFGKLTRPHMSRGPRGVPPIGPIGHAGRRRRGRSRRRARRVARAQDVANAASISRLVLALRTWICSPMARAAASTSLNCSLRIGSIGRIDEHGNTNGPGHQLAQEFQPLCRQLSPEKIDPRQVAARPGEAGDKTKPDRVFGDGEDDGDRRGCRLGRETPKAYLRSRRSRRPVGAPIPPPAPAADRFDCRPSGIRSRRSRPR